MTKGGGTLGRSLLIPFSFMPKKQKPLQKKGFFLWRRERDSSGDTGAVSPPARGTKKPFTGWFLPRLARPFPSHPFLFYAKKSKNPFKRRDFSFGAEKGIRPAILGQYRRQPGELKNHSPDGFLPRLARPFPSHPFLFYAQKAKIPSKEGIFPLAQRKGFVRRYWGSIAASPGN